MLFKEIIGQESVKKRLIQSVLDNRVSHAQLFLGPEGSGSLALALAYAQFISCDKKSMEDSCGSCASCVKYNKIAHPDLHFVFPVNTSHVYEGTKPVSDYFLAHWRNALLARPYLNLNQWYETIGIEKKQGLINAEESNEIIKKLSLKSYESEYKIMIIWMPEKMNPAASNKLLKLLEEPPDKTVFLLVCENQEQLLSTILSRTQLVKILRLSDNELEQGLIKNLNVSQEMAKSIAFLSEGNYNDALQLMEANENEKLYSTTFISWMRFCYSVKVPDIMMWVDEVSALGRERQKSFLNYAIQMIRESLLLNYADKSMVKLNGDIFDFLTKFAPFIHGANCMSMTEELNMAYRHIERNANPKILFLDLSFKMMKLLKVKY